MKIIFSVFFIFLSVSIQAQIIPIGTIKKTNKLHTLSISDLGAEPLNNWPRFQLKGTIQEHGSKAAIIENGFVFKEGYYGTFPDLQNAGRVVQVSNGTANFIATIGDFPQPISILLGTIYSVRAYAKNIFGQVSYSDEYIIQVNYNYCESSPCVNGAGCLNGPFGVICLCTIDYCDNCCASPASDACLGGGEWSCNVSHYTAQSLQTQKYNYQNKIIKSKIDNNIWYNNSTVNRVQPVFNAFK
jgi:hypothetical protein